MSGCHSALMRCSSSEVLFGRPSATLCLQVRNNVGAGSQTFLLAARAPYPGFAAHEFGLLAPYPDIRAVFHEQQGVVVERLVVGEAQVLPEIIGIVNAEVERGQIQAVEMSG